MKRFVLLALLIPTDAAAGAWLQNEGEGEVITAARYYNATQYFDAFGDKTPMSAYQKYEISPYVEYGIKDVLTIGGSLSAKAEFNESSGEESYNMGDLDLFTRSYLYLGSIVRHEDFVVSIEPGLYIPVSTNSDINQQTGISPSLKLNLGYSAIDYYADISFGYAYWGDETSDRVKVEANVGYYLKEDWTLLNQIAAIKIIDEDYTQSGNYDLVKAQSSLVWKYNESINHQFGVTYDIYGRNTGAGIGFLYSVWYKF